MEALAKRGTVLFVDDERRVLTSMRAMFRRDYDVLLGTTPSTSSCRISVCPG